jgi:hypothetical protein
VVAPAQDFAADKILEIEDVQSPTAPAHYVTDSQLVAKPSNFLPVGLFIRSFVILEFVPGIQAAALAAVPRLSGLPEQVNKSTAWY